jgi:2-keto-4-pentenoate hydratase/2-oxohepta-3-ene-1,7-dioic acid hydratase in catechol pathway
MKIAGFEANGGSHLGVVEGDQVIVWMKPGDTCEIDIEGVGVLVNPIAAE